MEVRIDSGEDGLPAATLSVASLRGRSERSGPLHPRTGGTRVAQYCDAGARRLNGVRHASVVGRFSNIAVTLTLAKYPGFVRLEPLSLPDGE